MNPFYHNPPRQTLSWFNNTTGGKTKAYQIYHNGNTNDANQEATFSKANGLGGLIALVDLAPIEVGNRVWRDRNSNGIQDAGESVLAEVTVQLLDAAGKLISTATTDAAGEYYFTSAPGVAGAATDPRRFNVPLLRDTNYTVRIPNISGTSRQAALSGLSPTAAGSGPPTTDSNGVVNGNFLDAAFRTGEYGQDDHTIDFGFRTAGTSVSGFIYVDANNNGLRETSETDVTQSVTLVLSGLDQFGNAVSRTVTTGTGAYTFANVPTSDAAGYTITEVNQPTGLLDGTDTAGTPFGGTGGSGATDAITGVVINTDTAPAAGGVNYNFGEISPAVLGDFVWLDANGDGRFQGTEAGVNGVTVVLSGTTDRGVFAGASAMTATGGNYLFSGLRPGTYVVTFGNTAGGVTYTRTFKKVGTDATIDSDADRASGASDPVILPVGGANRTIDAGLFLPVTIGDTVWADTNKDGVRQAGEPGIVGATVTVTAFGPDGVLGGGDDTTTVVTTGADGQYLATGLAPGNFRVTVNPATGTINGIPATGLAATYDLDSGTTNPNGTTLLGPVPSGTQRLDADFGFTNFPASLGDRVWLDRDGDGVQGAGEPGISGVPVTAIFAGADSQFGTADDVAYSTTTGANGVYNFVNLPLGNYRVTIDATGTNLVPTADLDSPAGTGDNTADAAVTAANPNRADVDFGLRGTASVGDLVYYDIDGNGVRGPFEPGIAGVVVTLTAGGRDGALGTADDLTFTATTDASGNYLFTGLPVFGASDPYRVTVSAPAGYPVQTFDADGLGTANQSTLTLLANGSDLGQDFGYRGPRTQGLGDFVWVDGNGNGRQDAGEPGINGVTVQLLDAAGNVVDSRVTDAAGFYEFRNLAVGTYRVRFGDSAGGVTYLRTTQDSPVADDFTDSDADVTTGVTQDVAVLAGTFNPSIDAGLYLLASLGNTVYRDDNGDGTQNGTEPGIAGVTVSLNYAGIDGVFGTADDQLGGTSASTDAAGKYLFSNLRPGTYRVSVDPTTLPAGLAQTADLDGLATANAATAAVASGQNRLDADFGYRGINSLGDTVWYDLDRSGTQNNNEPGIGGVVIALTGAGVDGRLGTGDDESFGTQTTDAQGKYLFANLPTGPYRAVVQAGSLPAGLVATFDLDSGLINPDGTADAPVGGAAGVSRLDVDFGYTGTGAIGDRVWFDSNGDGIQDPGEPGIPGLPVALTWAGPDGQPGTADDVTLTTTTGVNGIYLFPDLPAGSYTVNVSPTPGLEQTGDPDATLDGSSAVTLTPGQANADQDFGYRGQSSLGGTVYVDVNANGIRDAGEAPIAGVGITLSGTDNSGLPVNRAATTGPNGTYLFLNLAPGTYALSEVQPATYGDGQESLGSVGGTRSGTVGADRFDGIALTPGVSGVNYDFGELGGVVAGQVFLDRDRDGNPGATEPGIAGVVVTLRDANGVIVGTATTGPDGTYSFPGLAAGTYTVTETQPASYGDTPAGPFAPNARPITLPAGGAVAGQNFGDTLGTVSGRVYADGNKDGTQNPNEPGIAGVVLTLLDGTGAVVNTATTDVNGDYVFLDLPAGSYTLVEGQPAGYADGATTAGPQGGSTASGTRITAIPLAPGGASPRNVFGELGTGSVTGSVFTDLNKNGVRDPGEPGIPGVAIGLVDPQGNVVAATTTGPDGGYRFDNVAPGTYSVVEIQPAAYGSTPNTQGNTRSVTVANGQTAAASAFPDTLGSISGTVYFDNNFSATRDATGANPDAGVPGVAVQLLDAKGAVVATTVTDAAGNYRFDGLTPDTYTVLEVQPAGLYDGADNPGTLGGTSPAKNTILVTLLAGTDAANYDFGEFPPADPFGFVYVDANRNGVRDAGEVGIAGVAVTIGGTAFAGTPFARPLTAADVPGGSLMVRTDANGRWEFIPIPPGLYNFTEAQPAGYLDGGEQDGDPNGPPTSVGNDVFTNVRLAPFPVRGPFNFGEFLPTIPPVAPPVVMPPVGPLTPIDFFPALAAAPVIPTKRQFLGSTTSVTASAQAPVLPTAPAFSTLAPTPTFVAVGEDAGGGLVRVFDFHTGAERYRFAPYPGFTGGVHVATGDVTGDGVPDIVTTPGVGGGPVVRVFDGVTGQLVREIMAFEETFRNGLQLAVGDITGDGLADVVVAPDAGGGPIVRVFDGRTFAQVANFFALDENFRGGLRLATGDLNADGRADLVVTAGDGGGPRVAGYDGATLTTANPGKLFGDFFAFAPELRSGFYATVGDVDGDGFADILLGAGPGGGPRVASYSGRALTQSNTPAVLGDVFAGDINSRSGVRVMAVDLDGDGKAELMSATGPGERPVVRVTDPRTGATRDEFYAYPTNFLGGVTVG